MSEPSVPAVPEGVRELDIIGVRHGAFGASGSGDTSGFGGLVEPIVLPAPSVRPFGGWFDEITDEIELSLADRGLPATDAIEKVVIWRDEITYHVRREHLLDFVTALRDEPGLRFELCLGVSGVHYPHETGRELHAVYLFLSITHNRRIRVEVSVPDGRRAHPVDRRRLPDERLARARDVGLVRHRVRRPSRP